MVIEDKKERRAEANPPFIMIEDEQGERRGDDAQTALFLGDSISPIVKYVNLVHTWRTRCDPRFRKRGVWTPSGHILVVQRIMGMFSGCYLGVWSESSAPPRGIVFGKASERGGNLSSTMFTEGSTTMADDCQYRNR